MTIVMTKRKKSAESFLNTLVTLPELCRQSTSGKIRALPDSFESKIC